MTKGDKLILIGTIEAAFSEYYSNNIHITELAARMRALIPLIDSMETSKAHPQRDTIETKDIQDFYSEWCKKTARGGGVLIGSSIKELLASFAESILADPQAACPVWVKASQRLPEDSKNVAVKFNGRYCGGYQSMGSFYIAGYGRITISEIEWLDESGQQVFTREQVENMCIEWGGEIEMLISDKVMPSLWNDHFNKWFETNSPNSK